jgi:hypothetical protein
MYNRERLLMLFLFTQESVMAKSREIRKDVKKKPVKSIKEKRKAKLEKKSK